MASARPPRLDAIVATRAGRAGIRPLVDHELCGVVSDPRPAPDWVKAGA